MSSDPMVGQDKETQEMVERANQQSLETGKTPDEALQHQADMGPGREAAVGEGGGATGVMGSVKQAASSAMETLKEANPATRDYKEDHC